MYIFIIILWNLHILTVVLWNVLVSTHLNAKKGIWLTYSNKCTNKAIAKGGDINKIKPVLSGEHNDDIPLALWLIYENTNLMYE